MTDERNEPDTARTRDQRIQYGEIVRKDKEGLAPNPAPDASEPPVDAEAPDGLEGAPVDRRREGGDPGGGELQRRDNNESAAQPDGGIESMER